MRLSAPEIYPTHIAPAQVIPAGAVYTVSPLRLEYRLEEYLVVQPAKAPYEVINHDYARRLWIC